MIRRRLGWLTPTNVTKVFALVSVVGATPIALADAEDRVRRMLTEMDVPSLLAEIRGLPLEFAPDGDDGFKLTIGDTSYTFSMLRQVDGYGLGNVVINKGGVESFMNISARVGDAIEFDIDYTNGDGAEYTFSNGELFRVGRYQAGIEVVANGIPHHGVFDFSGLLTPRGDDPVTALSWQTDEDRVEPIELAVVIVVVVVVVSLFALTCLFLGWWGCD